MSSPTILLCSVFAACMAHDKKAPRLDDSAVNNSMTKEKEDARNCSWISVMFLDPQARLEHVD